MNEALLSGISLAALIGLIAIGFIKKFNIGILSFGAALILGAVTGMTQKEIVAGFNTSLFVILLGSMLLFGVAQLNGTISLLAKKLVALAGGRTWAVVIAMYALGAVVAALGPGTIPGFGIAAMFGVPLAIALKADPFLLCTVGQMGAIAGGIVPWAPTGVIGINLAANAGYAEIGMPLFINVTLGTIVASIALFIVYKGWTLENGNGIVDKADIPKFNRNQIITLISLLLMVTSIIVFKTDIGLTSFLLAGLLFLMGIEDMENCVKSIPWNTLLLVVGVGILMNVVITAGGIGLLAKGLASIMSPFTAPGLISLASGIMSWFSSTSGVVMPTMIPTIPEILANLNGFVEPALMVSAVTMGSSAAGISPASTGGALIMASISSEYKEMGIEFDFNKLFIKLFLTSMFSVFVVSIFALFGYGFTPY